MTSAEVAKSTWETRKPLIFAFAIGLLVGPFSV
jgi:hypothetical protein